jgi:hypothetical protein
MRVPSRRQYLRPISCLKHTYSTENSDMCPQLIDKLGVPKGIRTPVTAVKEG